MKRNQPSKRSNRRGAIAVLAALLMVLFVGMVAFSVDFGFIHAREAELQRTADAAALAAVQDLIPEANGTQHFDRARATVRSYVGDNLDETGFNTADADIQIGRFDPATIYTSVTLLNSGVRDSVRVTLRRDGVTNPMIPLFFARVLGVNDASISATATAVLQKPGQLVPGAGVLPFAVPEEQWRRLREGGNWTIYGDGKIVDEVGSTVSGNWGTLDIGSQGNSTSDLGDQIVNGLDQTHLDALYADGRIDTNQYINTNDKIWMQGDTGLSGGLRSSLEAAQGQSRAIPLYDNMTGSSGNNQEYRIVRWGIVKVIGSRFNGTNNTYVKVQKMFKYDGLLTPNRDLTVPSSIDGAFTSPVLVE